MDNLNTKFKQARTMKKGERIVFRSEITGRAFVYPVFHVGSYDREDLMYDKGKQQGPWIEAQLGYDTTEPDGAGGTKIVTKSNPLIFREVEIVEVLR